MKDRWIQVTQSEFPWEQEALTFVKERLPDHEPYRAWANFEFIQDGNIGEVDLFVISPKGLFLVEIKSWPGVVRGDAGTWRRTLPGRTREVSLDNPVVLANRKAKRLKSLLARQPALRSETVPFIAPLVFLSHIDLDCRLDASARDHVAGLGRDGDDRPIQAGGLPGVIDALAKFTPEEHDALRRRRIDRPMAKRITEAFEQAGIRPSQRSRKVADLDLGDLLDEGAGYQDFAAVHPRAAHAYRRVRIYGTPDQDPAQRQVIVRAAQREFELLSAVDHPGILKALDMHEHELGPALVYARDPSEIRLDHFLEDRGGGLGLYDRLRLLRDIAETVAYAHGRHFAHRALSPRSILVTRPGDKEQGFKIFNWQTGSRDSATGTSAGTIRGTSHVGDLVDTETAPYLAPESVTIADPDPQLLDVFSLGAIAYHVLTGQPPAASLAALVERLERDGALEVAAVLDGAGEALSDLVRGATFANATERFASMSEFLEYLTLVEEELTAPEEPEDEAETDPVTARPGDLVGGYLVVKRLGRGSTAVALLVEDEAGQQRVLKIAADPERNPRIRDEAAVLARLRDRTIIASHGEAISAAGHDGIVLSYADKGTLAQQLHRDGRLSLGTLERFGGDLLSALSYLEQVGITHRDIKPENLGVTEVGPRKEPHLVLMDFSLSSASPDQLTVGTRPYLDPFLGRKHGRPRWDLAGDRFAAAIVLHEMAAGTLPFWESRNTDPRFTEAEATVDRDAFPREIAEPLAELLERALARDAKERFDTADDLAREFSRIFAGVSQSADGAGASERAAELRAAATHDTPVTAIGLSARATDFLERSNVQTVADLIGLPPLAINSGRGIGLGTRRELTTALQDLRDRLRESHRQTVAVTKAEESVDEEGRLITLAGQLLPSETPRNRATVAALRLLLGLEPLADSAVWPSQTEVGSQLDVTRARVGQILAKARDGWAKLKGFSDIRDELVEQIDALGTVATAEDVERALAADRGSGDPDGDQSLARAVARAAVEVELASDQPRVAQRRTHDGRVLLATTGADDERQRALDYALRLGAVADEIASTETLVAPAEVTARLQRLTPPAGMPALAAERLVALAAAVSTSAAVSARLELHPRQMPAARALTLGRAALLGSDEIRPEEIIRRIAARFPHAEPLPSRPQLDGLLREAGLDLVWSQDAGAYAAKQRLAVTGLTSLGSSIGRLATATGGGVPRQATDPDVVTARDFERRLADAQRNGGMLSLMAYPQELPDAAGELRRLGLTVIDVDALLIGQMHATAEELGADWSVVVAADASDRASENWTNLTRLVQRAMSAVQASIVDTEGTVLLENVGLLGRYAQLSLFDRLREQIMAGAPLRACWTLIPTDDQADRPAVDGHAIPVLTTNEYARIPKPWLRNLHRAA
ncbi:BREX system serine/threonine kinase PglW [Solirubrobacter taibaiensis]|nr:BREX system serine/threonine kinase PglW [Solirubrobacter taibaiensis]